MNKPTSDRIDKTHRYDQKLNEILHTSARVFADKGFHHASVRDISRATGISLAGLYYYFQTKEELLFLILEHTFDSVMENLESSVQEYKGRDKIRFFIQNHLTYFAENLPEMKVASHESDALKGTYRDKIQEKKRMYFDRLVEILTEIQSKPKVDPKIAALTLFGMVNWIYTWYRPDKNRRIKDVAGEMAEIFLNGYLRS